LPICRGTGCGYEQTDIQVREQKISKLKDQMLQAKSNDVYRAFQNGIEFCQKEMRKSGDRIREP
jgi:hypothetical protein